jgi:hypothetical protein
MGGGGEGGRGLFRRDKAFGSTFQEKIEKKYKLVEV